MRQRREVEVEEVGGGGRRWGSGDDNEAQREERLPLNFDYTIITNNRIIIHAHNHNSSTKETKAEPSNTVREEEKEGDLRMIRKTPTQDSILSYSSICIKLIFSREEETME